MLPAGRDLDTVSLAEAVEEEPKQLPIAKAKAPELLAAAAIIHTVPNRKPPIGESIPKKCFRHRMSRKLTQRRHPQAL